MQRQVRTLELLLMAQAQPMQRADCAINGKAADQCHHNAHQAAQQLADQADTAHATQCRLAKDAAGNATPHAAQAMKWPHAQHVVDLPAVLRRSEGPDEQRAGHQAGGQCANRVHQVGAGANRHQAGQRPVVQKTWVVAPGQQGRQGATDHGHERVDRY
ncbi:hypothetical protein D3C81_1697020 [compost metagenome]